MILLLSLRHNYDGLLKVRVRWKWKFIPRYPALPLEFGCGLLES